jgi:hypothetical protein
MFRRNKKVRAHSEGENPFLLTFSDFMASLLAIFILVLMSRYAKQTFKSTPASRVKSVKKSSKFKRISK